MRNLKLIACVALVLLFQPVSAAPSAELNATMQKISEAMLKLLPAVHATDTPRGDLARDLELLQELVAEAGPHLADEPLGSRMNYTMLQRQLQRASSAAGSSSRHLVKGAVANAFELCAGCHALDGVRRPAFGVSKLRDLDNFLAGEYSYLTRDYPAAEVSYLESLKWEREATSRRADALFRLFALSLMQNDSTRGTISDLEALAGQDALTDMEADTVRRWQGLLVKVSGESPGLLSPVAASSVAGLARMLASDWPDVRFLLDFSEQQAYWMLVRQRLHEFLAASADPDELPVMLYWLGVSDRYLRYQFYETMAAQYLEECIRDFPTHPYAGTCYEEYELLMVISYSGSSGVRLPPDVLQNLEELRALVNRQ